MEQPNVFDELRAEDAKIYSMLSSLPESDWNCLSSCEGWTVADVVLHLAQTDEAVVASITGAGFPSIQGVSGGTVDELMANWVETERGMSPDDLLARWRRASDEAARTLEDADPRRALSWAAAPLKPRTLATTRLSEHWIHAHDIADPLGIDYPDTSRLGHIAWLAHRTIPFAFARAGLPGPPTVRLELSGPQGEEWTFGAVDSMVTIRGAAGEFARIAARRLTPSEARNLSWTGDRASQVLECVRTYA